MRTNAGGVVHYPEDIGSKLSRNTRNNLPDHTASYTGRLSEYVLWQKLTVPLSWLQNDEADPTPNTGISSCLFKGIRLTNPILHFVLFLSLITKPNTLSCYMSCGHLNSGASSKNVGWSTELSYLDLRVLFDYQRIQNPPQQQFAVNLITN